MIASVELRSIRVLSCTRVEVIFSHNSDKYLNRVKLALSVWRVGSSLDMRPALQRSLTRCAMHIKLLVLILHSRRVLQALRSKHRLVSQYDGRTVGSFIVIAPYRLSSR